MMNHLLLTYLKVRHRLERLLRGEEGQDLLEYVLIGVIIIGGVVALLYAFRGRLADLWQQLINIAS